MAGVSGLLLMARHALFPLTSLHALETQPHHKGPNVNLQRDPRWGRALEVPSEDPILSGQIAAAMTLGIQNGEDKRYVKLLGALKHFTACESIDFRKARAGPPVTPST